MQNEMGENITPLAAVDYTPHLRLLLEVLNNGQNLEHPL